MKRQLLLVSALVMAKSAVADVDVVTDGMDNDHDITNNDAADNMSTENDHRRFKLQSTRHLQQRMKKMEKKKAREQNAAESASGAGEESTISEMSGRSKADKGADLTFDDRFTINGMHHSGWWGGGASDTPPAPPSSWDAPPTPAWPPSGGWEHNPPTGWDSHSWDDKPTAWNPPPPPTGWERPPTGWDTPRGSSWWSGKSGKSGRKWTTRTYYGKSNKGYWNHDSGKPNGGGSWYPPPENPWVPPPSPDWKSSSHDDAWASPDEDDGWHDDSWGSPYYMSPFSCGNMCIDAYGAMSSGMGGGSSGGAGGTFKNAVKPCITTNEYSDSQQWLFHQKNDLVQVESYAYKGKCIAINYDGNMYQDAVEQNCNKGTLALMPCDTLASRWYFTGGELLSYFCWSRGFSTNMAVAYNTTEAKCNDELVSTNDLSGVTPPPREVFDGVCGTSSSNAESTCDQNGLATKCRSNDDCPGGGQCYSVPDCYLWNLKYSYCGTSQTDAKNKCATKCEIDADCPGNEDCWPTQAECPEHGYDIKYGGTFMFIEQKEMKNLYEMKSPY